jgi:UDP-galactopyranose mutase
MSRLTLELPETLHRQLETQARIEGTSLDKYLLYALTRHADYAYRVLAISKEEVAQQRAQFDALRKSLPKASSEEIDQFLAEREAEREASEPNDEVNSQIAKQLRQRIKAARAVTA